MCIARAQRNTRSTDFTASDDLSNDRSGSLSGASSTAIDATAPFAPARLSAVDRARDTVAHPLLHLWASSTAVSSLHVHLVVAILYATATSLCALRPCVPAVNTVDRTRLSVAVARRLQVVTRLATVRDRDNDRPGAGGQATATLLRASGPDRPAGDGTVRGTSLNVASATL